MRKIIVLEPFDEPLGVAVAQEADIVVRRVVQYKVIKNRHGAWGQTVDTLDELT